MHQNVLALSPIPFPPSPFFFPLSPFPSWERSLPDPLARFKKLRDSGRTLREVEGRRMRKGAEKGKGRRKRRQGNGRG